jgi:preprotein translocase subunit SecG
MSGILGAFIVAIHVIACVALMVSILLQSGKGGGLAGAFGAGSSQTLFGGRGAATFLSRTTTVLAVIFFTTSLTLGLSASRSADRATSLIAEEARRRAQERPASQGSGAPVAPAPQGAPTTPAQGVPGGPSPAAPAPGTPPATSPAPVTPAPTGGAGK